MAEAGFKKKNGCLGVVLLSSVIWSLSPISVSLAYDIPRMILGGGAAHA